MSGSLGCQGTIDHLRPNASNERTVTAAAEGSSPQTIPTTVQAVTPTAADEDQGYQVDRSLPSPTAGMATPIIPAPKNVVPVTLAGALRQAGAENPVIAIAQQAVQSALGLQLQARVLLAGVLRRYPQGG
jgi:hypothetical protein